MQRRACGSSGSSVGGSKRQPGKGACCSPRHTPRMFHGTGALLPSRLEPSSCSLRDRPTSLSAVGESERVQGHGNGSTLASFLERSSWYASEACLASGVPGSSVSTSSPPSPSPSFLHPYPRSFRFITHGFSFTPSRWRSKTSTHRWIFSYQLLISAGLLVDYMCFFSRAVCFVISNS